MKKSNTRNESNQAETKCANCGMEQGDWADTKGHEKAGKTYCCKGCADGTGCVC